jgi:Pectate lyase superfamily protein/Periplasmic copper-binding protein (NosD)
VNFCCCFSGAPRSRSSQTRFSDGKPHRIRPTRLSLLLWWLLPLVLAGSLKAQTQVNVTNYGLRGDAIFTIATAVSNSDMITLAPSNQLSAADEGKLILLFGAGPVTSGTNTQDLVAQITGVPGSNRAQISVAAGRDISNARCIFGTQNSTALQQCINSCNGTNTTIFFPAGTYLMVPPAALSPAFAMTSQSDGQPAVIINKGGLHLLGAGSGTTTLLGNGAWQLKGQWAHRGFLFFCQGPVTNNFPLIFENLTFDGGVAQGNQQIHGSPASTVDGSGWDETHGALVDIGPAPLHAFKQFLNCRFVHWRGEMIKSVTTVNSGLNNVTGCSFIDGDGSGFNLNWMPHLITGCLFSNVDMAMEYYVGTMSAPSVFENSVITNTRIGIVLVGALSNSPSPGYTILGNSIASSQYGVMLGPARNLTVAGNTFWGGYGGVATDGAGYQGTDFNQDVIVENNQFFGTWSPILVGGAGADRIENLTVSNNLASACSFFGNGWGWMTNVICNGNHEINVTNAPLNSTRIGGQYFFDDPSNDFPPHMDYGQAGASNIITYALGRRHQLWTDKTNAVFVLDDTQPWQIPPGAQLDITNASAFPVAIYSSTALSGTPALLPNGAPATCHWTNGAWQFGPTAGLMPPANLHVIPDTGQ